MGSQCNRQRMVDRNHTDHIGQSLWPLAQAHEDRLRLRRQRYAEGQAEKKASSSSQHVAFGSQGGIRRKIIEMVDKLKSLSDESVDYESQILTQDSGSDENNIHTGKWDGVKLGRAQRSDILSEEL
ncbi:hypothetical protein R1sor_016241 [Riccia sorocarpa]|uniref:Uncharacterized protein n=1 Tax=Riccia sorocarpa TaxID=122646 RepID=A0ABD3HH76_9MARC